MKDQQKTIYLLLLAVQIIGAIFVMRHGLPAFRELGSNPGEQLPDNAYEYFTTAGALLVMQAAYWYRFSRVRIPFQGSNVLFNHLLLFFGRLTFIFGGALFSVVLFRHLPAIDSSVNMWLMARRGLVFVITLFSLFCMTLELERLGHAIGSNQQS